jgi:hypothetical protein
MINRQKSPVDTIYMEGRGDGTLHVRYDSITFDRPSHTIIADSTNGVFVFTLATPLAPGEALRLRYAAALCPSRIPERRARSRNLRQRLVPQPRRLPVHCVQRRR